ncbi:hypothetical protein BDZ89DRAFT_1137357 [Hymenopellis radicata]|nr:hypothetical protein BDZ89DRAFT_1137357 [Hymenopellis radicata]
MSSITEFLDSLHSHLQAQSHLLPSLHDQLGLPVSALEEDLAAIKQILIDSVEAQIESRRQQVEMWMAKCEAVEQKCIVYSKFLGGHIKNTGELSQLYNTNLEERTALSSRLHAMARVLGNDFFTPDVLDDDLDTSVHRDVSPEIFLRMEEELARGKAEVSKRLQQLCDAFEQIDWLHTELGKNLPSLDDLPSSIFSPPSFSSASMSDSRMDPFVTSNPTPTSRNQSLIIHREEVDYWRIFANFVANVEKAEDEHNPFIGLAHVDPTPGLLKWSADLQAFLEDDKRKRETHIQAIYYKMEDIVKRFGVKEVDMGAFVEAHLGCTDDTIQEYELLLDRMLELKRERICASIVNAREEIVKLRADLMVGEDEREGFLPFSDEAQTEELLKIHLDEVKKLEAEKRMKAPLLDVIKKYFEIIEEEKALAVALSDQSRLTRRVGEDPKRLLREEEKRNKLDRVMPPVERKLLALLLEWELKDKRPFLVFGKSMLQELKATQENKRKHPRAGSVPPRSTTPAVRTKSAVVVPAVRPAGSSADSAPNKRPRLNESTDRLGFSRNRNASASKPNASSSLPRQGMPIPKPGTQHYALGHGRVPSTVTGRTVSGSALVAKKASRARRESFRPRPSLDTDVKLGASTRAGFAASVREEDARY